MKPTPEQVAKIISDNQAVREARRAVRAQIKEIGGKLMVENGLNIIHAPQESLVFGEHVSHGACIVWKQTSHVHGNVVEVATALQHHADEYDRYMGRYLAAQRFDTGRTIRLHVPNRWTHDVSSWLKMKLMDR